MKRSRCVVAAAAAVLGLAAQAQQPVTRVEPTSGQPSEAAATAAVTRMHDGEVRRVDAQQGKVTLKHGPIASLEMPAMTMVFRVADSKLLDGLKVGDKVRFAADRVNGSIVVTAITAVP